MKPPPAAKSVPPRRSSPAPRRPAPTAAETGVDLDALQGLLDTLPAGREPLDVVMVDGYLCGVLLQPRPIGEPRWLLPITDVDGAPLPRGFDRARLRALVARRHDELARAIADRQWFDPWVYQLDDDASASETVLPWVAGFATALELFGDLMARHGPMLTEPLAALYRHLDPDDLEDADELLAEIDTLEPAATLDEAVEDLVRSVLLIADVSRPRADPAQRRLARAGHAGRTGPWRPAGAAAAPRPAGGTKARGRR